MAKWSSTSETGILRKKPAKDKFEDLLVFGYACKLFRDDEKALYIDQGKHLIPWMGDEKLRIDRYDCRGALSELASCEASREGYDAMRWLGLNETERKIEQLCDEERYYALHANEEEEAMYKEEELKRLQQKTNEYQYSYDAQNDSESSQESTADDKPPTVEEDDRPYVPPPELDVPADITIPKTVKENARIVKTAHFISQQGPQMEILIKTKQADNPQFAFMNSTDPLYKFYRHVLQAIKNGTYSVTTNTNNEQNLDDSADHDSDEHYLHPTLITASLHSGQPPPAAPLPPIPYRPSADCSYSQLVNRIQGTQLGESINRPEPPPPPPPQLTYEQQQQQQQYYQYYYMMQCYEYYKQMIQYQQTYGQEGGVEIPPHIQEQLVNFAQYMQQHQQQNPSNPYAQIVSNLSHSKDNNLNLYPLPTVPQDEVKATPNDITKAAVLYNKKKPEASNLPVTIIGPQLPEDMLKKEPSKKENENLQNGVPPAVESSKTASDKVDGGVHISNGDNLNAKLAAETTKPLEDKSLKPTEKTQTPLLSLVHYGTDSEEDSTSSEEDEPERKVTVKTPPTEMQIIMDKMASYVAKNGADFEAIVKSKGDPRFDFLNSDHEYHPYYRHKIYEFSEKDDKAPSSKERKGSATTEKEKNGLPVKTKEKKVIAPVCFSIKKPKEHDTPKEIKSALPLEESDEESEEVKTISASTSVPATKEVKTTASLLTSHSTTIYSISNSSPMLSGTMPLLTNNLQASTLNKTYIPVTSTIPLSERIVTLTEAKRLDKADGADGNEKSPEKTAKNGILDGDDPILEMIDLTYDLEERRDAKRAEDKIKDKLAAAAREKLASVARDRALQLERKKKAAAFLKLKSVECDKMDDGAEAGLEITPAVTTDRCDIDTSTIKSLRESKDRDSERKHKRRRSQSKTRSSKHRSDNRSKSRDRSSRHRSYRENKDRDPSLHSKSKSRTPSRSVRHRSYRTSKDRDRLLHSSSRSISRDRTHYKSKERDLDLRNLSRSTSRDVRSRSKSHRESPKSKDKDGRSRSRRSPTKENALKTIKENDGDQEKAPLKPPGKNPGSDKEEGERSRTRSKSKDRSGRGKKRRRSRSKSKEAEMKVRKKSKEKDVKKRHKSDQAKNKEDDAQKTLENPEKKVKENGDGAVVESERLAPKEEGAEKGKEEESGTEEGEIKKHRKSGKKKKSHKRKRSRSRHGSKTRHHKKSKKRRRSRSSSRSYHSSSS